MKIISSAERIGKAETNKDFYWKCTILMFQNFDNQNNQIYYYNDLWKIFYKKYVILSN